jgi:hypothetical protein
MNPGTKVLITVLLLAVITSCRSTPSQQPEPNGVTVFEDGQMLHGITDLTAEFTGVPVSGSTVTISFSTRFDPIANAIDDEYRLTFSLTFSDASILNAGSVVDLSSVAGLTGLFEKACFCGEFPRYTIASGGTLTLEEISSATIKGSLNATLVLVDRVSGITGLSGKSYEISISSFSASRVQ